MNKLEKQLLKQILINQDIIMLSLISCATTEENIFRVQATITPEMKNTHKLIKQLEKENND